MATPDRDSYYIPMQGGEPGVIEPKRVRTYKLTLLGVPTEELYIRDVKPTSSTVTPVTRTLGTVTLAAENMNRMALYLYNDTAAACYVKLGSGASNTDFTYKLTVGSFWVLPQPTYTGIVTGYWVSGGTANVFVTELYESPTL